MNWYYHVDNSDPAEVAYKLFYKFVKIQTATGGWQDCLSLGRFWNTFSTVAVRSNLAGTTTMKEDLLYIDRTDLYTLIGLLGLEELFEPEEEYRLAED